jgi:hypothetical protein
MAVSNVTLPSGERVNISHEDDATELDVLNFAFNEYVTNTDPGSAFGRGIRDGVDLLQTSYGSTLEGIGSLLDSESLQQVGADVIAKQRGEMDAEAFRQQRFGDQDQGLIDYTLNLAGTSSPIMGATLAGAGAGFVATGFNPLGAIAGGFLANMPFFYGDNRERQKEAIERGFRTEMDEGAAALYAVPQSLLDAAFSGIGAKFLASGALKAGGGLLTRATRGAVEGAIIEAPTELGQQFLNRYQAGLPTDSDEAKLEYVEAAKGGALLGGLFGGGTRAVFGSKEGADAMPAPATEETVKMPPSVTTPEGEAVSPEVEEILEGEQAPQSELTPEDEVAIDTEIDESLVNRPPPVEQDRMPTVTGQELETQPAPEPLSPDSASAEVAEAVEEMLTAEDEAAIDAEMEREFFGEAVLTADDEAALDAEIRRELSDDTITQEDLPVATSKIIKEFEGMTPKQVEEARFVDEQAKSAPVEEAPKKKIKITAKVLSNLRKTAVQIAGAVGSRTKVELTTFYSKDEDRSVTFDAVNNEGQFDIVDGNEIKGKELPVGTVVDARINKYEGGDFELFDSRELRLKEDGTWEKVEDIARLREEAAMPKAEGALTEEELLYVLGQMGQDVTVGADGRPVVQFTEEQAFQALPIKEKVKFNNHKKNPLKKGAVRLNLNSKFYTKNGQRVTYSAEQERAGIPRQEGAVGPLFVQTLHPIKRTGTPNYDLAHSYGRAFTIRNATFSVNPFAKTIIRSKADNKYPMASVDGDIVADAEPNLEGEVLSFNPFVHDSFVDSQGREVIGADEVTVYGTKGYARGNIRYSDTTPEVVTASEILSLARQGKKYVHPKFHPRGKDLSKLSSSEIEALEALAAQEGPDVTVGADTESIQYNLLNSPFILEYSGRGPQDTRIPNYNSFHYVVNDTQQQALNSAIQSGAVDALADEMVNETTEMMKDPEVSAGMGWYGRMRTRLSQIFGADRDLFTHLLGTTSAQTAVEQNFRYSVNLYNRFKAGEFDPQIKRYLALRGRLQAGTLGDLLIQSKVTNSKGVVYTKELIKKSQPSALLQNAARHFNLLPTQPDGQLFGANSYPALKALSQVWFADRLGKNRRPQSVTLTLLLGN